MKLFGENGTYKSDIVLGKTYEDEQTGYTGIATSVHFFQHACERVCVERINPIDGKIEEQVFDSPRLIDVETRKQATTERTGGPARTGETRSRAGERR